MHHLILLLTLLPRLSTALAFPAPRHHEVKVSPNSHAPPMQRAPSYEVQDVSPADAARPVPWRYHGAQDSRPAAHDVPQPHAAPQLPPGHPAKDYVNYENYGPVPVPTPPTPSSAAPVPAPSSTPAPAPSSAAPTPAPSSTTPAPAPSSPAPPSPPASKTSESPTPAPKETAQVFVCSDANWSGKCAKVSAPLGAGPDSCTQLDGTATSIGPDEGFDCFFYTNAICRTIDSAGNDMLVLTHPGSPNVGYTPKGDFNDKFLSFQCLRKAGKQLA